ncbi:peptidase M75 family protein [Kineosporia mesophila]|uniref:Peptidase M75 family protein n=1 Tax=Kineosporia mesophila TaxID=566012 RepID=A0ABP6ZQN7_9ACTN|nr:iron uptake system protein EfeO [Kineosporia mesophila]MCD5355102.1 cupredoxin domain-containing protein [Kineosporia mesophila]
MPEALSKTFTAAGLLAALVVSGCSSGSSTGSSTEAGADGPITVDAGDTNCDVSTTQIAAGQHTFSVTNSAGQVTEVYVYADGDRIMGEVENIGPALKRELIVDLPAGTYQVACKPGMVGNGNRTALTVTGATPSAATLDENLSNAVDDYKKYVNSEAAALVDTTKTFTDAIDAGDMDKVKAAYPAARLHYERIEPIAESFGDLDPLIDMRIDDATDGTTFTGFHALEQLIYEKDTLKGTSDLAQQLDTNVEKLQTVIKDVDFTPLVMGNGAKSLLDEVAKSKVTGEEERYSRIDLVDFAGNVDGARYVYTALRPALQEKDPALVKTLDERFPALVDLLETHRAKEGEAGYVTGSPYVSYDDLSKDDVKALAIEVDAISEPLGQISGVVSGK